MKKQGSIGRIGTWAAVGLVLALSAARLSVAQEQEGASGEREKQAAGGGMAQLRGEWTATFSGVTGCGVSTVLIDFTLDSNGSGTQTLALGHTAACGDNTTTGLPVQIESLNSDGSGVIGFSCGDACGFVFTMQVSRNKQLFNMAAEPMIGNWLAGVAIRK